MSRRSLPTRTLAEHPDLDQLKRQARELLEAFRAGNPAAVAEVAAHYPERADIDSRSCARHPNEHSTSTRKIPTPRVGSAGDPGRGSRFAAWKIGPSGAGAYDGAVACCNP